MRIHCIIAAAWLALASVLAPAHAEKRVALVVGNGRYANLPDRDQLRKAVSDARAVGAALRQIGFDVISGEDLGRGALVDKLDELTRRLAPGDTAFFFFSGHGVALDGANYILPADVPDIASGQETRLKLAALGEADIVSGLSGRGVGVAIVVLDACRTNPFKPSRPGLKSVGVEKGLAPPPQVRGVFSLYAAGIGQSALDRLYDGDDSPNSVFSRVLVPALTQPGRDLSALAVDVRQEVARIAQGAGFDQQPAYYDGLTGRFFLAGPAADGARGGAAVQPPAGPAADEVTWNFVKDARDADLLHRFIARYPASPRRHEAEERLSAVGQGGGDPSPGIAMLATPVRPADAAPLTAAQERGLTPKDSFRECTDCPEMVVVPAGSFTMGSPASEKERYDDEGPQHAVTIDRPFAVGKTHVTVDQFRVFVTDTGYSAHSRCDWRNPGFEQDGSHPVVCVSWDDANAYAQWLALKTGKSYRLLSEAESEYAARAGTTTPFWWGSSITPAQANYDGNYVYDGGGSEGEYRRGTVPPGSFKPNPWGLYNVHGNTWQWTADCYHDSYEGAPADGSAWTAGDCKSGRVVRGGSWLNFPGLLRAAQRGSDTVAGIYIGVRVARTLTP